MAKKLLRIMVDSQLIVAPVWDIEHMSWSGVEIGCPYCKQFSLIQPKVDVTQFGLDGCDTIHTVTQCKHCNRLFALKYTNTNEVIE